MRASAAVSALWLGIAGALACSDPPAHVASASCPLKTPGEWQAFLESALADPAWITTCSDISNCGASVGPFARHVEQDIVATLDACSADIANNPPIARCSDRLRRFVPAWLGQHSDTSYGFDLDNRAYFAAQTSGDLPSGMMDLPAAMIAALPSRQGIELTAREQGWPYLTHDSCLGGVRTFVTVSDPDGRFDQWFLFGINLGPQAIDDQSIVSFIAVQKMDAAGNALERVRLHFRDYLAARSDSGWSIELPEDGSGKCYACHGSGMRQLLRARGSVAESAPVNGEPGYGDATPADFGVQRLASLNQRLLDYGLPDWSGTLSIDNHGPALGDSLACTHCHNGATRGLLTVHTSEGMLWQKIVEQLSMRAYSPEQDVPDDDAIALLERERQGDTLSDEEALALDQARAAHLADFETFTAARFPSLQAWALAVRCE